MGEILRLGINSSLRMTGGEWARTSLYNTLSFSAQSLSAVEAKCFRYKNKIFIKTISISEIELSFLLPREKIRRRKFIVRLGI